MYAKKKKFPPQKNQSINHNKLNNNMMDYQT